MARSKIDPVQLEVFHHLLGAYCEEAGARLRLSAISPNIRERADYSVAVFDRTGALVSQAAHIPVHLGSAGDAVRAVRDELELEDGDVAILNDPYCGGTHLPDVTMVRPVFCGGRQPEWFVVNRAHHADIGGATPGSMGIARDLFAEGLVLPPVLLRRRGRMQRDLLRVLSRNVRGAEERLVDLRAQEASLAQLELRLASMVEQHGLGAVRRTTAALMDYSERAGRAMLRQLPRGVFAAGDALDDDGLGNGPLPIALRLKLSRDHATFDWRGTCDQAPGGVNANRGIALAACVYAIRCLCPGRLPTNEGLFRLRRLETRPGSLVDPRSPAPVAGGNVETSQRLVDVALQALSSAAPDRVPAASAGTMSNLTFGGLQADGVAFASYETLPGGAGASRSRDGQSAIQTHMTNTRNTPIEELERRAPLRVRALSVRRGSGGRGARRGGDGLVKAVEALQPLQGAFLGERQRSGPPGADGGGRGKPGRVSVERGGRRERLPAKCSFELAPGDAVIVETPGGGGHGAR
ncbi:MAG: hydantoinase B/oxoprolinase family protein [Planctomycetota bacterium]|nr:hydantoinase B/oxoprolinase family protein [Planctomycetota bacterium]